MSVSYARRVAYVGNALAIGRRSRSTIRFVTSALVIVAVLLLVPRLPARELIVGIVIGAAAMTVLLSCVRIGDSQMRGHMAEQFSLDTFGKIREWLIVDNLPFDGFDVDHVVITPSAVLAVETKYRSVIPSRDDVARHGRELAAAERGATRIRNFLRSKKVLGDVAVIPVLMVWGPGAPDLESGYRRDGLVYLLDGDQQRLWTHVFSAPTISRRRREEIHRVLVEYQKVRHDHQAKNDQPLHRAIRDALLQGVRDARDERRSKREIARRLRRRHGMTSHDSPAEGDLTDPGH